MRKREVTMGPGRGKEVVQARRRRRWGGGLVDLKVQLGGRGRDSRPGRSCARRLRRGPGAQDHSDVQITESYSITSAYRHIPLLANHAAMATAAAPATSFTEEVLPPALGAVSEPPPLFDGTTRLYICYICPFAQRAWVTRNCKGLQDEIKLVAINLEDKPAWYKDKVYPQGTVPSLEHDGKVVGESLDLIKYIDRNFQGPALLPQDPAKRQFADELIAYADAFTKALYAPLISRVDMSDEAVASLDKIEAALSKFSDGPFFLGQLSLADIAYVTILERIQIYYSHLRSYEIAQGRPNVAKFIEGMNKIEAYKHTKNQPLILLDAAKRHLKIA